MPPEHELTAIEAALGKLVPSQGAIDRDLVMFEAGRFSARRSTAGRAPWVATTGCLALVALAQAFALARRPAVQVVERTIVVERPAIEAAPVPASDPPAAEPPRWFDFSVDDSPRARLARQVIRYGLDGLPPTPGSAWAEASTPLTTARAQLNEELRQALYPGDPL